jgi:hypothetical protein
LAVTSVQSPANSAYQVTLINGQVYLTVAKNALSSNLAYGPAVPFSFALRDAAGNTATGTTTITAVNNNLRLVNLTTGPLAGYDYSCITGSSSSDQIVGGGGGDDIFMGGRGGDLLTAGTGNETFVYGAVADSQPGSGRFDVISNFNAATATIDLSEIPGRVSSGNIKSLSSAPTTVGANSIIWYYNNSLGQTVVYVNPTNQVQKTSSRSIMKINLVGKKTSALNAGNFILPAEPSSEAPTLLVGSQSVTVNAGGTVALPINLVAADLDDQVTVTIRGLTRYETLTDNLDHKTFSGSRTTLTLAEVNSGLTLKSSYTGTGHPVNTLTVTANNTTSGETAASPSQTITVTDPAATNNEAFHGIDLSGLSLGGNSTLSHLSVGTNAAGRSTPNDDPHGHTLALQYMASSFVTASDGHDSTLMTAPPPDQQSLLSHPHA